MLKLEKKSSSHSILRYTQIDHTKGTYTSKKPVMLSRIDYNHLKCDFVDHSIVIGIKKLNSKKYL